MDTREGDRHTRAAIYVRLDPELADRLRTEAAARDLSMNYLVAKAVRQFLDDLIPVDEWKLTT
jgi:predicted HicB family RNase H-like nuclease